MAKPRLALQPAVALCAGDGVVGGGGCGLLHDGGPDGGPIEAAGGGDGPATLDDIAVNDRAGGSTAGGAGVVAKGHPPRQNYLK